MKRKRFIFIGYLWMFLLFFVSCKKDNGTTGGGPVLTSNQNTLSATGDISGTFSGILLAESFSGSSVLPSTSATAAFFSTPQPFQISKGISSVPNETVTSVYVNSVMLKFQSTNSDYGDTTNALVFPPAKWVVNGNSVIPTFTYSATSPIPFINQNALPVSINRTQNLSLSMNGFSGYDQVEVQLTDSIGKSITIFQPGSVSSITFVKDSLAKLSVTRTGCSISYTLLKYNPQTISNKNLLFVSVNFFTKVGLQIQ